jgi:hypothetical protein
MRVNTELAMAFLLLFSSVVGLSNQVVRLYIARQYSWDEKVGFHLYLQSTSEGESPCRLENLYLNFGIGDGKNWRTISSHPQWIKEREYVVEAKIDSHSAELWLDGELVGKSEGDFVPSEENLTLNYMPIWGKGKSEFLIILKKFELIRSNGGKIEYTFPQLPIPLFLFEPQFPYSLPFKIQKGEGLIIKATFSLLPYPDLKVLSPFIDEYGQCIYGDWEGKIRNDEELRKSREEEEAVLSSWGIPKGYDRFGGYKLAGWREKPTGFFRVVRKNGFFWLISPEGNPCFYIGLCGVPAINWDMTPITGREYLFSWLPPKEGQFSSSWARGIRGDPELEYVSFHTCNMIRKYGENWREISLELTRKRLRAWGFSGAGKWGEMEGFPCLPVLYRWDVPNLVRHPDIFDPIVRDKFKESLRKQVEARKNDPYVVGWSLGNEYGEIINSEEIREILKMGSDVPAKRALISFALEEIYRGNLEELKNRWGIKGEGKEGFYKEEIKPPPEDLERLRQYYAEKFYEFIYRTIKEIDPNHLYFGFWITPGWWENENDWKLIAKYCDVIGYDLYSYDFMDVRLRRLVEGTGKPIFCGEFSFPPFYEGRRGFGIWEGGVPGGVKAKDDREAGELYGKWLKGAAVNPYCVGVSWFIYRDQHITGIGGERQGSELVYGEHYAFGIVDIGDRPKWELVKRMREANLSAIKWRLNACGLGEGKR